MKRGKIMKKLALLFLVAILTCALVGADSVLAQATFTPISGDMTFLSDMDSGKEWVDDEGITHIRGRTMDWAFVAGSLLGYGSGIYNADIDEFGNGVTQGFHFFDVEFQGEPYDGVSGTFEGHAEGTFTNLWLAAEFVGHGDGGFAGMHFQLAVTLFYGSGVAVYEGILHNPHGGGGDKVVPADSQTWGSVKALYR